jgi:hypothetical protein
MREFSASALTNVRSRAARLMIKAAAALAGLQ